MEKTLYKCEMLGFPIIIVNPVFKEAFGDHYLDIDNGKLMKSVFKALANKRSKITGAELKFIRGYMKMSQEDFARIAFGDEFDRSKISRLEANRDKVSGLSYTEEMALRAKMLVFVSSKTSLCSFYGRVDSSLKLNEQVSEEIEIDYGEVA
jgi:DNA-binding transcriptional regulator YiaG